MRRPAVFLFLLAAAWDFARAPNPDVDKGNDAYRRGVYDEAITSYRKALEKLPKDPGVHYDLGTALYQKALGAQGKGREELLDQAQGEFLLGTDSADTQLKSNSYYNLGNTFLQRDRLDEAIGEYKKALKVEPSNARARHNLELALKRKQQKQQQQQQQQQPQDQPQKQEQQPQDQPQQPEQQPQDQPQQPEQQPPSQPQDQPEQPSEPQPSPEAGQQDKPEPQPSPQQQPAQSDKKGQPPREHSDWQLDTLERLSKDLQVRKQRIKAQQRRRGKPVKDY
jgi:Ca-activated chloride channel homolog